MRLLEAASPPEKDENIETQWVMYWMRTAMRGHDNPALDAALSLANAAGLPLLVYQELRTDGPGPHPNGRHHTFVLEGAKDVQRELEARGITYALHVEMRGEPKSHLLELARRSAALVVEDLPVYWHRGESAAIAEEVNVPVYAVDTACVVPVQAIGGKLDRAFEFRAAHGPLLRERIAKRWISVEPEVDRLPLSALPFTPVDFETQAISDIVAACDIDQSIGPVGDTRGGSAAAYQRWRAFRDGAIHQYHRVRNDPTRPHGVSRLSAYLHHGQISPFRVARQAAALEGEGAQKFFDELMTWREFAHHVGSWQSEPPGLSWLPDWARETLKHHEEDPRPALYDWETLARGKTDDALWNLCQKSLLAHGELHNNLRMTWGKQFLQWTTTIEQAIALAIDLNDRYALDGGDPNSYLGILWCFGTSDRPFEPEEAIVGRVRPRSTTHHAKRLDMQRYREWVERPGRPSAPRVAVIGAGLSGLICARTLQDHGIDVEVFDKARGPGGRISTRYTSTEQESKELTFDHGAQYFTARSEVLMRHVLAWQRQGIVDTWSPRLAVIDDRGLRMKDDAGQPPRYVGTPGMNAIAKHLARDLCPEYDATLTGLSPLGPGCWELEFKGGAQRGPFDAVVLTAPGPQAAELIKNHAPSLASTAREVDFTPTWALMLAFEQLVQTDFDAAFVNSGPLGWIARNRTKPDRVHGEDTRDSWVIHATPDWSRQHLELPFEEARNLLENAFFALLDTIGVEPDEPVLSQAHRWRYARAEPPLHEGCLGDDEAPGIILAGDWLCGSRVEGAFQSGLAAAARILSGAVDTNQPGQTKLF